MWFYVATNMSQPMRGYEGSFWVWATLPHTAKKVWTQSFRPGLSNMNQKVQSGPLDDFAKCGGLFFFFFCLQTSPAQGPPSTYPFVFLQFTGITAPKCWSDFSETWARHHLIGLFPKFAQWHSHIDRVAGTFQFSKEALLLLVLLNLSMDFNGSHYFVQYNQPKLITLFLYFTCYNNMWIVIDHEADDLKRDCQCDWAFYFTALCTRKNCITGCTLFCSIIFFWGGDFNFFKFIFIF